jgi:N utilization substance protein B
MATSQEKFREILFQILFSATIAPIDDEQIAKLLSKELAVSRKTVYEAIGRVRQILAKKQELDSQISRLLDGYEVEQIQNIEMTALRLALFELKHDSDIPPKVAISEAIRLVKKFGQESAISLINGVLDRAWKETC